MKGIPLWYTLCFSQKMKRRIIIWLFLAIAVIGGHAQKAALYLFPEFIKGRVMMKNGAQTTAWLNYDAANGRMMFKQGNDIMILTNSEAVDTIYMNNRKFCPIKDYCFLECIPCKHGMIYVNWSLQNKYKGEKGAYGQISHAANVEMINTSYWTNSGYKQESLDVYKLDNDNEYWLKLNGEFVKCKNKKSLLKLFPHHKEQIEQYIEEQKIDFSKADHMINLLNFCLDIEIPSSKKSNNIN